MPPPTSTARPTLIEWALRPFGKVRPGEGVVTALMLVCVFLILTSYYVMKTAREGLILSSGSFGLRAGELKAYANGAMAVLLIAIVPAYSALAHRAARMRLISVTYVIAILSLLGLFVLAHAGIEIGLVFFVWLGVISVLFLAQFWSYATDIYSDEQGKRLFAIIGLGAALGAITGPSIAKIADTYTLLLLASGLFVIVVLCFHLIDHIVSRRTVMGSVARLSITGPGGFELVRRDHYLILIAAIMLIANLVNTMGEYILSTTVAQHAAEAIPSTAHAELVGAARSAAINADRREWIKAFYANFYLVVNLVAFVIQGALVSRMIHKYGVRRALFVLPVVALTAYGAIALIGGIAVIRAAKIGENSVDYSVQNTVRATLFLPTSRAVKYKAKAALDTFFVRAGDTVTALLIWIGVHQLGLGVRAFAAVNIGLVLAWMVIALGIARHHHALEAKRAAA